MYSKTEYQKLDLSKLKNRKRTTTSSENALKDITPINWGKDVLAGKDKVIISKQK